jgi:hypothetical protein
MLSWLVAANCFPANLTMVLHVPEGTYVEVMYLHGNSLFPHGWIKDVSNRIALHLGCANEAQALLTFSQK